MDAMRPRKALEAVADAVAPDRASGAVSGAGRGAEASHLGNVTIQAMQAADEKLKSSTALQRILPSARIGDARSSADAALANQGGRTRSTQCPDHLTLFGMIAFLRRTAASCDLTQLSRRRDAIKTQIEQVDPDFREQDFAAGAASGTLASSSTGRHSLPRFSDDPELRRLQQELLRINGRIDAVRNLTDAARLSDETSERIESILALLTVLASEPLCRSVLIARCLALVPLLMNMIRLPLDHGVKAAVLRILAVLARDLNLVPQLWVAIEKQNLLGAKQMRSGQATGDVVAALTGIRSEFYGPERDDNDYRASTEFSRLLRALVAHREGLRIPAALGAPSPFAGAWPYARFTVSEVLATFPSRVFGNEIEKWQSVFPALGFASDVLRRYRVCSPSPLQLACDEAIATGAGSDEAALEPRRVGATGASRGAARGRDPRGPVYPEWAVRSACARLDVKDATELVGTMTGDFCPVTHQSWAKRHSRSREQCPKSIGYEVASQLLSSTSAFKAVIAVLRGGAESVGRSRGGVGMVGAEAASTAAAAGVADGMEGAAGLVSLRLEEAGPSVDIRHAGAAPELASKDDIGQVESETRMEFGAGESSDGAGSRSNPALQRLEQDEEVYDRERVRQDALGTPDEDEGWWRERCVLLALQLLEQATRIDVDFKNACTRTNSSTEAATVGELLAAEHEALRLIAGYVSYPSWLEPRISACALQLLARLVVGEGSHIGADIALDQLRGDAGSLRKGIASCIAEGLAGSEEADLQLALEAEQQSMVELGAQNAQVLLAGCLGDPDDPPGASGLVDAGVGHGTGVGL